MRARAPRQFFASLTVAGALLLAGCLNVGRDFETQGVRQLQIGRTTQSQVRELFGEPWRTGVEDGRRTWTYGRYRYALLGATQTRDLVVRFDDRGVVTSYTFNSTDPNDELK
jgi:outer membrane protein assembly factor BamE (lipoprotein component of BamABCDE complex)